MNMNGTADHSARKCAFLRIFSALMLLCALPMLWWCLNLINNAALDYDYAGIGCFGAALVYAFSMVTAIAGLTFAGKPHRYGWCRTLAYIQLAAGVLLIFPLRPHHSHPAAAVSFNCSVFVRRGWREMRGSGTTMKGAPRWQRRKQTTKYRCPSLC